MAVKAGELRTAGDVVLWWLGRVEQKRETSVSYKRSTRSMVIKNIVPAVGKVAVAKLDRRVLDEIGASKSVPSDFELLTLFAIINGRYERMLPTVIISNLKADELVGAIGERCIDRLREGAPIVVKFKWESARRSII